MYGFAFGAVVVQFLVTVVHPAEVWIDCTFETGKNPCSDENAYCYVRAPAAICRCKDGYLEDRIDINNKKCVKANGRWLNCDHAIASRNCSDPNAYCPSSGKIGADCKCKDGYVIDRRRFNDWRCVQLTAFPDPDVITVADDMKPFKCSSRPSPCNRKNYAFKNADCYCLPDLEFS